MNKPDKNLCLYWGYILVKKDNKNEHDKWVNYMVSLQKASAKRKNIEPVNRYGGWGCFVILNGALLRRWHMANASRKWGVSHSEI